MRLFGFEIKRVKQLSPKERMIKASAELTEAWSHAYEQRAGIKPWINWDEKRVLVVKWGNVEEVE